MTPSQCTLTDVPLFPNPYLIMDSHNRNSSSFELRSSCYIAYGIIMITDLLSSCQDETRKLEVDGVVTKSVGPEMGWERCQGYPSLDVWFRN